MYKVIKRFIDIALALLGIVLLSPLFLGIIVFIKLESKGPIFFKQKRIGLHKKEFYILKFRTMRIDTPSAVPTHLLKNPYQWITKVGKVLRRTSLDELSQIWNILVGHMSLVGPRPALWNQFDLIEERDKYGANDILPGLTGWAQINGRDELSIPVKAKFDGYYVKNCSFVLDCRCVVESFLVVFKRYGHREGGAD